MKSLYWILQLLANHYRLDLNITGLKRKSQYEFDLSVENGSIYKFVNYITDLFRNVNLSVIEHHLSESGLESFLSDLTHPVMAFSSKDLSPIMITEKKGDHYLIHQEEFTTTVTFADLKKLIYQKGEKFTLLDFMPTASLFHKPETEEKLENLKGKPVKRLFRMLGLEKKDISYIYIYAIVSGIVYLSLPLGIQAIIGLIMSGRIVTSVVILVIFVLLGIAISGVLNIMQITLIEYLQRRLFTKAAFEFAFRIPKIKLESILDKYAPELMNRFFDIMSVKKGLSKLLMDFSLASLQIIFGLFLLAFYHPFFIFFGLFLLMVILGIIWLTGPKGLTTSIAKSKEKYKLAHWLEEMARTVNTFKLAGFTNLPLEKTDQVMTSYLTTRKKHFGILLIQYYNMLGFKLLVTGGTLILGAILVINKEINIGQFVAAEIIIILVINAVEKLILSMDVIYDVLTAVEKLGEVTDLPLESGNGLFIEQFTKENEGFSIAIKDLTYQYPGKKSIALNGIDLQVPQGQRLCISGFNGSGKSTLTKILCGFYESYQGIISFNDMSLRELNINSLRWHIGDNLTQEEVFSGTFLENITLGRHNISTQDVLWAIELVGLTPFIKTLNQGLDHTLISNGQGLAESTNNKIILARSIVHKPKLLLLNDTYMNIERGEKKRILKQIYDRKNTWTIINISNDPFIMEQSDRVAVMQGGKIVETGTFKEISGNDEYTAWY